MKVRVRARNISEIALGTFIGVSLAGIAGATLFGHYYKPNIDENMSAASKVFIEITNTVSQAKDFLKRFQFNSFDFLNHYNKYSEL